MPTLDDILEQGARVLWVAAHPDDECFSVGVLAKAALKLGNPLHMLVLTRGEGGEYPKRLQDGRPLGDVRQAEMEAVARAYGATLEMESYFNASLPVDSFPYRHEIAARWAEHGDPAARIARTIRAFKPDLLLTFPPVFGATGHPEHQLASRFATAGVRLAAAPDAPVDGEVHRVAHTYYLLMRYKLLGLLGGGMDPFEPSEIWDARQPCVDGQTCVRAMAERTRHHQTQAHDMGQLRLAARFIKKGYLLRADPFTESYDPFEEHPVRGMG